MPEKKFDQKTAMKRFQEIFGDRMQFLAMQIIQLSQYGQRCDVTFYKSKPAINVKIDEQLALALIYGAGAKKLKEMLENIRLSDGETVSINEIWTIMPMPSEGISEKELAEVDMALGEQKAGPNGETVRQMIRNVYHCESDEETEKYLRRYLAS